MFPFGSQLDLWKVNNGSSLMQIWFHNPLILYWFGLEVIILDMNYKKEEISHQIKNHVTYYKFSFDVDRKPLDKLSSNYFFSPNIPENVACMSFMVSGTSTSYNLKQNYS